jgi:hypothetical protein
MLQSNMHGQALKNHFRVLQTGCPELNWLELSKMYLTLLALPLSTFCCLALFDVL